METSFQLIDPAISEGDRSVRVGKGFHGLQLYANEFWPHHLIKYVQLNDGLQIGTSSSILAILSELCNTHVRFAEKMLKGPNARAPDLEGGKIDPHLIHLSEHRDIYVMAKQILDFRQTLQIEQQESGTCTNPISFTIIG